MGGWAGQGWAGHLGSRALGWPADNSAACKPSDSAGKAVDALLNSQVNWRSTAAVHFLIPPMSAGKAVDALLNFETVTLCGNSGLEVRQYDTTLTQYQVGTECCVCCVTWQLSRRWG